MLISLVSLVVLGEQQEGMFAETNGGDGGGDGGGGLQEGKRDSCASILWAGPQVLPQLHYFSSLHIRGTMRIEWLKVDEANGKSLKGKVTLARDFLSGWSANSSTREIRVIQLGS